MKIVGKWGRGKVEEEVYGKEDKQTKSIDYNSF